MAGLVLGVSAFASSETTVSITVQATPNATAMEASYTVSDPGQGAHFVVANIVNADTLDPIVPASIVWDYNGTDTWLGNTAYVWNVTLTGLTWGTVMTLDITYNDADAGVGTDGASTTTGLRSCTVPFHIQSASVSSGTAAGTFDVAVQWQVKTAYAYLSPVPTDMLIFYMYLLDTTSSTIAVQPVFFEPSGSGDGSSWSSTLPLSDAPTVNSFTFSSAPLSPGSDAFALAAVWINANNSFQFGPTFTDLAVCLGEDTLIRMADGTPRAIGTIGVGDAVATAGGVSTIVTAVRRMEGGIRHQPLWCVPDGVACATTPLWLTGNHAFWHSEASYLAGDAPCTAPKCAELSAPTSGTTRRSERAPMWNLQLANRGIMFANGVAVVGMS